MCTKVTEDPTVSLTEFEHKLSSGDTGDEATDHMTLPPRPAFNRADSM